VEAVKYLQKAADSGVPLAQYRMGLAYYLGRGMPLNYTNAAGWFFTAARQGHAVAQNNLGVHYFQGLGVQQNIAQAVKWYTCSAEQGYRSAQKNLGMEYRDGIGVQRDYIQAYKWFDLAATNEEGKTVPTSLVANVAIDNGQWYETSDVAIESMQLRDQLATYMTPAQLTAAQQLARKWRPKEKTCVGSH
jgi:TPR repeat protein